MLKNLDYKNSSIVANWIANIYIFATIVSFLHAIITEEYNGDFNGISVEISIYFLTLNLLLTLAPVYFCLFIYNRFRRNQQFELYDSPNWINILCYLTFALLIWNIFITILFGYAQAGREIYQAPFGLNYVIQISTRFNAILAACIVILAMPKNSIWDFIFVILLFLLAVSRFTFGILMALPLIFLIKYNSKIVFFYNKNRYIFFLIIFASLLLIAPIYEFRSFLRGESSDEQSILFVIFSKFSGRLSSYSNSSVIIQNFQYFLISSLDNHPFFYQNQLFGGMFSGSLLLNESPELVLFNLFNKDDTVNATFMAGVPGILYISLVHGPFIVILNLFTYFLGCYLIFKISSLIKSKHIYEVALMSSLGISLSGVSNEIGVTIMSYLSILLMIGLIKLIGR